MDQLPDIHYDSAMRGAKCVQGCIALSVTVEMCDVRFNPRIDMLFYTRIVGYLRFLKISLCFTTASHNLRTENSNYESILSRVFLSCNIVEIITENTCAIFLFIIAIFIAILYMLLIISICCIK